MHQIIKWGFGALVLTLLITCSPEKTTNKDSGKSVMVKYARNFQISTSKDSVVLKVLYDGDSTQNPFVIRVGKNPDWRIAAMASPYVGHFSTLGQLDKIHAVGQAKYIYSQEIVDKIEAGSVLELGSTGQLSGERLLKEKINCVIYSAMEVRDDEVMKLNKVGIQVVPALAWREEHPLGRAEWLRFYGYFLGVPEVGDGIFAEIEKKYLELKGKYIFKRTEKALIGNDFKGTWYLPGGNSYVVKMVHDAGGDVMTGDEKGLGGVPKDFEQVFVQGKDLSLWLHPGMYTSLEQLGEADERYKLFRSFQKGRIFNHTARVRKNGGNDYWETGQIWPDRVLGDLMHIFHPDQDPNYKLYYYQQLE